jgi:1,4-dihydroxy-6-naphthoate synthase
MPKTKEISLGHSPDPDDAFMFHPLALNRIDTGGLIFRHILQDIQTLNERTLRGELDVSAVSIHAYPRIAASYALMPCGASMGDGYGPMVVATQPCDSADLRRMTIAVPGTLTSAFLALRLHLGKFEFKVVPFDKIFEALRSGEAEAGLIIHEGQLTYQKEKLHCIVDLGAWWKKETGLPLPLGGNAIKKSLGPELVKKITSIVKQSIAYALGHTDETIPHVMPYARDLDAALAKKFVRMYVNDYTIDYGEKGRAAIAEFLERGRRIGLIQDSGRLQAGVCPALAPAPADHQKISSVLFADVVSGAARQHRVVRAVRHRHHPRDRQIAFELRVSSGARRQVRKLDLFADRIIEKGASSGGHRHRECSS